MANKSIKQYAQDLTPVSTDGYLLQRGNEYLYSSHIDMMMGIQRKVVTLTQAQVQGLNASFYEIVPAQGAGKVIDVLECTAFHDSNGTSFGAGYIFLRHSAGSNEIMTFSTSFQTSATDRYERGIFGTTAANQLVHANSALLIDSSAVFAGNGGTITFDLLYVVKRFS